MPPNMPITNNYLVVCTGNICRSPVAQIQLEALFSELGIDANVSSAGTGTENGLPMEPPALATLSSLGLETHCKDFTSTRIQQLDVMDFKMVVVMTKEHRKQVLKLCPVALKRTFTLSEIAALCELDEMTSLRSQAANPSELLDVFLKNAFLYRSIVDAVPDIVDPYKQSQEVWQNSMNSISTNIEKIRAYLNG